MEPSRAIESYRDLEIWKRGLGLAKACYVGTRQFPKEEVFGLTSQIRRASSAIKELETHLILSMEIGILQPAVAHELLATCDELGRMLRALIRKLDPS